MARSGPKRANKLEEELPQARRTAEVEGFGAYVAAHRTPSKIGSGWLGLPVFLVFAVLGLIGVLHKPVPVPGLPEPGPSERVMGDAMLLIALALGVALVFQERRHKRDRAKGPTVYGYERGMVIAFPQGCEAHPWHDVLPFEYVIIKKLDDEYEREVELPLLELRTRAGKVLTFAGADAIDRFADLLAAYEVPRARECLERGESVTYGAFTLSASSLAADGRRYPWQEVRSITTSGDTVRVLLSKGRASEATTRGTPHFRALCTLIQQQVDDHPPW